MGLPVDLRDSQGATPLFYAVRKQRKGRKSVKEYHDTRMLRKLIKLGADINAETERGELPWTVALSMHNFPHARLLLRAGANIMSTGAHVDHPINALASFQPEPQFPVNTRPGHRALFKEFLKRGVDLNQQYDHGYIPLELATQYGTRQTVSLLIKMGADATVIRPNGDSLLVFAMMSHGPATDTLGKVITLLKAGAPSNAAEIRGPYAFLAWLIRYCEYHDRVQLLDQMLPYLASQNRDSFDDALHEFAAAGDYKRPRYLEVIDMLVRHGAILRDENMRHHVAKCCIRIYPSPSEVRCIMSDRLLNDLMRMDMPMGKVRLLISCALKQNAQRHFHTLLASRPDALSNPEPQWLYWAVLWEDICLVQRLLDAGADVNSIYEDVTTPLAAALRNESYHIASLLLSHDANPLLGENLPVCHLNYVWIHENFWYKDWVPMMTAFETAIHCGASLDMIKQMWYMIDPTTRPEPEMFIPCAVERSDVTQWLQDIKAHERD